MSRGPSSRRAVAGLGRALVYVGGVSLALGLLATGQPGHAADRKATAPAAQSAPQITNEPLRARDADEERVLRGTDGRWAVLIGVEKYEDDAGILDLSKPVDDVQAMSEALIGSGAFLPQHVVRMTWSAADAGAPEKQRDPRRPTGANILREINRIVERPDVDTLVVYFSGHGAVIPGPSSKAGPLPVILPQDAARVGDRLVNTLALPEIVTLIEQDERIDRRIIILDACRDKLESKKGDAPLPAAWGERRYRLARGTQILFPAAPGKSACECTQHSCFTQALLDGLDGDADGVSIAGRPAEAPDGVLTMEELHAFAEKELRDHPTRACGIQVPYLDGRTVEGELALMPTWRGPTSPDLPPLPETLDNAALAASLAEADASYTRMDLLDFRDRVYRLRDGEIPRLTTEVIQPELAAQIHRTQALYAEVVTGRPEQARDSLAAALRAEPGASAVKGLAAPPPSLIARAGEAGRLQPAAPLVLDLSRRVEVYIDGARTRVIPLDVPVVVQVRNCDGDFQGSWYRLTGQGLPSEVNLNPDIQACLHQNARRLGVGAAASAGLAAGLGVSSGIMFLARERAASECPASIGRACPEGVRERVKGLNSWRGRAGWGAVALAPVAIGLGIAAVVTW